MKSPALPQDYLTDDVKTTDSVQKKKKKKKKIIRFIRSKENFVFEVCDDISDVKLVTGLTLNFNHLNEHDFRHNFTDTINPICNSSFDIEAAIHHSCVADLIQFNE